MMNDIQQRKLDVRAAKMPRWDVVRGAAQMASNGLLYARKAELLTETLSTFIMQLYEKDSSGQFVNIDPIDYRLMVKVPWRKSWDVADTKPALKATERAALRAILKVEQMNDNRPHLLHFDSPKWYLELHSYRNVKQALAWVDSIELNAGRYNRVDSQRRAARRDTERVA